MGNGETGTLSVADIKRIVFGFLIAAAGFVSAYVTQSIIPQIDQTGTSGMLAVAGFSVLVNVLQRLVRDTRK